MKAASTLYIVLDLLGTFVFALSGAVAAREKRLDIFGMFTLAFSVACGGGIFRDLCLGVVPPVGLTNWLYLLMVLTAALLTVSFYRVVNLLNQPVLVFDALGLSVFAVTGARKSLLLGHNYEVAVLLGMVTAVGGGVIRDVLLNRIPVILQKEIYASAALAGALVVVAGAELHLPIEMVSLIAVGCCFALRLMGLHFHWNLPSFRPTRTGKGD